MEIRYSRQAKTRQMKEVDQENLPSIDPIKVKPFPAVPQKVPMIWPNKRI